MGVMGWATTSIAKRYQHVTDPVRLDLAKRVGGLLWKTPKPDKCKGKKKRRKGGEEDGPSAPPIPA